MPTDIDQSDIRFRIAAARRILYREGCDSNVGGHVSARDERRADSFWVTGFEYFDQTLPEQIVQMDLDLKPLTGRHELSPAVNFHALIYKRRPDVKAIVHLHSHYLSVLSSTGKEVGMYNVASVLFHNEQATYFDDGIKSHLEVVDALGDRRVVHIKNHGAIVASESIERAAIEALTLEKCARIHLECEAAGGTELPEAEVVNGKAMYQKYYLRHMWEANWARLRTSDRDLFEAAGQPSEPSC
jgi:L-fuculose-phosphate aldolase